MADLAIILLVLIMVIAVTVAGVAFMNTRRRGNRWRTVETTSGNSYVIYAVKGHSIHGRTIPLGSCRIDDPGFSYKIEELRSECLERVVAMNAQRYLLK